LHELNAAVLNDCTALRAVVEHGHLEVRFRVEDRNGRVDWIVVAGDFLVRGEVEGGALVNDPLLHLKTVRVGVERAVAVDVVCLPVHCDFSTVAIIRKACEIHFPI